MSICSVEKWGIFSIKKCGIRFYRVIQLIVNITHVAYDSCELSTNNKRNQNKLNWPFSYNVNNIFVYTRACVPTFIKVNLFTTRVTRTWNATYSAASDDLNQFEMNKSNSTTNVDADHGSHGYSFVWARRSHKLKPSRS